MKSFKLICLFLLLIFFSNRGVQAQEKIDTLQERTDHAGTTTSEVALDELYETASEAYRGQDYKKSIVQYEKLVALAGKRNKVSAELCYNLGNAYFRDNQLGKAILNYERALLLDPGDGDIRHNLRFARNRTEDRIDTAGNLIFTNWFNAVRNMYSSNRWAAIGIVLFILFLVCLAVFLFVRYLWAKKTAFYTGIVLFLLVIAVNIFSFSQKSERIERDSAIVMVGAAMVNASPDLNSNELFQLHEGTKVKIRNSDSNWYEIEIANGSVGWTSKENVEII
jgi:tetratricopeptide (TPR) repeat protein